MKALNTLPCAALCVFAFSAAAADYPAPKQADWIARDFRFHTGDVMGELRLHYTTIGEASGEPVLILHGTTGSGSSMLTPAFAGELFRPGEPLDARGMRPRGKLVPRLRPVIGAPAGRRPGVRPLRPVSREAGPCQRAPRAEPSRAWFVARH